MSNYKRGDIVILEIPFFNKDGSLASKGRPALIVSSKWVNDNTQDIIIAVISSNLSHNFPTNYQLLPDSEAFKQSGLIYPSVIKCINLFYISKSKVNHNLGHISEKYMREIDKKIKTALFD